MSVPPGLALIARARQHGERTAVVDATGTYSYAWLLEASARTASALLAGRDDLGEARVAFLLGPGARWVQLQWAIWRAGGVAVPLCAAHPAREIAHVLDDAGAEIVVADAEHEAALRKVAGDQGRRFQLDTDLDAAPRSLPDTAPDRRALILYTSGTTGRPKGVVTTHEILRAQIECLVDAWEWRAGDRIVHVLPLHHVHGLVNALACALWAGSACDMLPRFDAGAVWERLVRTDATLFMAVPTIYSKLATAWNQAALPTRDKWSAAARALRLMVSGSAALPVPLFERWRGITGQTLLERYGMTEVGMALSNPLHGERIPGTVGTPLPGVEVRLVDDDDRPVAAGGLGEIEVRGPGVFLEYWERPEETAAAFRDGWFRTGDVAVVENGRYRILGRKSTDIIKSGGYKISALEIEDVLRTHPAVADCAVVGVPDPEWGERVAAALELRGGEILDSDGFRAWSKEQLATYKAPTLLLAVEELPRNVLGKVRKPAVRALFGDGAPPPLT